MFGNWINHLQNFVIKKYQNTTETSLVTCVVSERNNIKGNRNRNVEQNSLETGFSIICKVLKFS